MCLKLYQQSVGKQNNTFASKLNRIIIGIPVNIIAFYIHLFIAFIIIPLKTTYNLVIALKNGQYYDRLLWYLRQITLIYSNRRNVQNNFNPEILNKIRGKCVVITDGNTELGRELAKVMVENGATVIIGCRQPFEAFKNVEQLKYKKTDADISLIKLDLSSMKSVREFASKVLKRVDKIDVLINNGSLLAKTRTITDDGFEFHFAANHLSYFLLTHLLIEPLRASDSARVVIVSCKSYIYGRINVEDVNLTDGYTTSKAFFQSKLANVLFARQLAIKLSATNITTYCCHCDYKYIDGSEQYCSVPRFLQFLHHSLNYTNHSNVTISRTTLYCAFDDRVEYGFGEFYSNCKRVETCYQIVNDRMADRLWAISCHMLERANYPMRAIKFEKLKVT